MDSLRGPCVCRVRGSFPFSFAHGEEELDMPARQPARPPVGLGEQAGGRWQPAPNSRSGVEQAGQPRISPSASAPAPQARSYGAPQAVYNEPHGDRGIGGDSSVSYAPSPGGRRLQPAPMAPPRGYPGMASSPYGATTGSTYMNQGSSVADQGRGRVPAVLPSPGVQSYGGQAAAPTGSAKVLADDDDADTVEPEFNLEYDDED
jgi:hypothetical protein